MIVRDDDDIVFKPFTELAADHLLFVSLCSGPDARRPCDIAEPG